jgi:hypothetical protein
MTTAYTSLLGLALPVTGELSGVWGDTVNNSITSLLDSAIAGTTTLSSDADVTLTTTTGASNTSRQAILLWTAGGTVTRNITAPAQSKIYTVINKSSSTQSIVLRGVGPTTGVTIVQGESAVCAWNGSDFIKISNTSGAGVFTTLSVSGAVTLSGGTANGVAYLNGSKVLTTGSALVFDGTNLGIGTSSPNIGGLTRVLTLNTPTGGNYSGVELAGAGTLSARFITNNAAGTFIGSQLSIPLVFETNATEAARIDSSGNLGIGTTAPNAKVEIVNTSAGAVATQLFLHNASDTDGTGARLDFAGLATGTIPTASITNVRTGAGAYALTFSNYGSGSNTERARIDSSGNLGLGVTPSAWSSSYRAVQIANSSSIMGGTSGNDTYYLTNAYFDTGWKYAVSSKEATRYNQVLGAHAWYTAPTGTAGNTITWTQAMTLDSSGNLGVGTTSPSGRLDVQNNQNATSNFYFRNTDTTNTSSRAALNVIAGAQSFGFLAINADNTFIQRTSGSLQFQLAGSTQATLDSSGNFSVTTGAIYNTRASGNSPLIDMTQTGVYTWDLINTATTAVFSIRGNTNPYLSIASTTGVVTMQAYGAGTATFSAAGVISSVSDETWKIKDGVPTDPDSMLKKLEPGYWYYNDEKKEIFGVDRQLGFYAQNVNAAIGPEAASVPETTIIKNKDGTETTVTKPWGYYDRSVLAVTVMSLQKALATIETLTARITALEGA